MVTILSLIMLAALSLASSQSDQRIDCRKFVFAPMCRGVAAKRSERHYPTTKDIANELIIDPNSSNDFLQEDSFTDITPNEANLDQPNYNPVLFAIKRRRPASLRYPADNVLFRLLVDNGRKHENTPQQYLSFDYNTLE